MITPQQIPNNEREYSPHLAAVPELIEPVEFVPKFKHIQEDLNYMFGIEIKEEGELTSPAIKKKMYDKAVSDFKAGNPFSLEYFLEEDLLSPHDIKKEDLPALRRAAHDVSGSMKHLARRKASKDLFVEAGIFTEEEVNELPSPNQ